MRLPAGAMYFGADFESANAHIAGKTVTLERHKAKRKANEARHGF